MTTRLIILLAIGILLFLGGGHAMWELEFVLEKPRKEFWGFIYAMQVLVGLSIFIAIAVAIVSSLVKS